jgi:hypothetical protein
MQLKNNESRNRQFYFYKKTAGSKTPSLEVLHIPGGATVEIEDEIFEAICSGKTTVSVMEERMVPLDKDNIGAQMKTDGEILMIKEYYDTGRTKEVNLVKELIKEGKLAVTERPHVKMETIDAFLNAQGISVKDMPEDAKLALYDKLA